MLWLSVLFWAAWCLPPAVQLGWPLPGDHPIAPHALIYCAYATKLLLLTRRVERFHWINLLVPIPVPFFPGGVPARNPQPGAGRGDLDGPPRQHPLITALV